MDKELEKKISKEKNTKEYQECITCGKKGHTYLACPEFNFVGACFGLVAGLNEINKIEDNNLYK